MKPSKAIEILKDIIHYVEPGDPPEEHQAIKLGIEALKALDDCRKGDCKGMGELLPGETPAEEED